MRIRKISSISRKYILLLTVMPVIAFQAVGCKEKKLKSKSIQYVKTTIAESLSEESMVSYPGKTKPSETTSPSFKVSGTISRVYVNEGDYVKKGDLIAELDAHDYEVQLEATQAEYEQIKADAERVISMYEEGTATASNYDKARYGLDQISQKLSHHRDQVTYCKLYSPISGYVQSKLHDSGENVSAGMPVLSLFSSSGIEIEVFIPASDYARRSRMTRAICVFEVTPDAMYSLDLSRVSKEANASQLYMLRFSFKKGYDISMITPGMTTMVYVSYSKEESGGNVRIPTSCVIKYKDQSLVYIYDKETSSVKPRVVTTGKLDTRGNIEIRSGLNAGEVVVSAGVRFLKPGQKVKEADKTTKSNIGNLL